MRRTQWMPRSWPEISFPTTILCFAHSMLPLQSWFLGRHSVKSNGCHRNASPASWLWGTGADSVNYFHPFPKRLTVYSSCWRNRFWVSPKEYTERGAAVLLFWGGKNQGITQLCRESKAPDPSCGKVCSITQYPQSAFLKWARSGAQSIFTVRCQMNCANI